MLLRFLDSPLSGVEMRDGTLRKAADSICVPQFLPSNSGRAPEGMMELLREVWGYQSYPYSANG